SQYFPTILIYFKNKTTFSGCQGAIALIPSLSLKGLGFGDQTPTVTSVISYQVKVKVWRPNPYSYFSSKKRANISPQYLSTLKIKQLFLAVKERSLLFRH
ncbi:hypothetical protein, partial [Hydrocoleum sp. CS-953]|uniref:hypothetical protein n=1 Tax=Hydrocoleum sp. CS-953 TaxID=1671698 RepID=UPI001AEF447D